MPAVVEVSPSTLQRSRERSERRLSFPQVHSTPAPRDFFGGRARSTVRSFILDRPREYSLARFIPFVRGLAYARRVSAPPRVFPRRRAYNPLARSLSRASVASAAIARDLLFRVPLATGTSYARAPAALVLLRITHMPVISARSAAQRRGRRSD